MNQGRSGQVSCYVFVSLSMGVRQFVAVCAYIMCPYENMDECIFVHVHMYLFTIIISKGAHCSFKQTHTWAQGSLLWFCICGKRNLPHMPPVSPKSVMESPKHKRDGRFKASLNQAASEVINDGGQSGE